MPTPVERASSHAALRRRLAKAAAAEATSMWRTGVEPGRIQQSWLRSVARLLTLLTGAQKVVAAQADNYLDEVLDTQDIDPATRGYLNPDAFSGIASDGRDLQTLLYQPAVTALTGIQRGGTVERSLAIGQAHLDMIVQTQIADAGRVADEVAMVARPQVNGWIRMITPPACSRCAILAGKFYRWNDGFERHPSCLPAGVVASGPEIAAATRRWYQGELVVLTTASGQELPITGNHPVLTNRGWIPANLLQEGDCVVRSIFGQGATPLVVPDEKQIPSRVEDLWRSSQMSSLFQMPTSAEDFHGDGGHGDVHVVFSDRLLRDWPQSPFGQPLGQILFPLGSGARTGFYGGGALEEALDRYRDSADGIMGGGDLRRAFFGGHLLGSDLLGCRNSTDVNACIQQSTPDRSAGDPVPAAKTEFAFSGHVGSGQLGNRKFPFATRWDAPSGPLTMQTRGAYADRGKNLFLRLAGQVELDRVVDLRRVEWSGHVYNLNSTEGWFSANSLIVSNCLCVHIPADEDVGDDVRTDPRAYFDSLSAAEQDRVFTKAGAEAIRLGADLSQVVNARRGARGMATASRITAAEVKVLRGGRDRGRLQPVNVFGQDLLVTTEGTTSRGQAGRRLGAREDGVKKPGGRYRSAKAPRLMPEQIIQIAAGDRDEAVRLLFRNGYLLEEPKATASRTATRPPAVATNPRVAPADRPVAALAPKPAVAVPAPKPPAAEPPPLPPVAKTFEERVADAASEQAALQASPLGLHRPQSGLNDAQSAALAEYQDGRRPGFRGINATLRGTRPSDEATQTAIAGIDSAMAGSILTADVVVYRGVRNAGVMFGDRMSANLTGMRWREDAYVSTSADRSAVDAFSGSKDPLRMRILAPQGVRAIDLEDPSDPVEAELLLDRGYEFAVVEDLGVVDGVRRIDVEVIAR